MRRTKLRRRHSQARSAGQADPASSAVVSPRLVIDTAFTIDFADMPQLPIEGENWRDVGMRDGVRKWRRIVLEK
jgi:hypothetical protein